MEHAVSALRLVQMLPVLSIHYPQRKSVCLENRTWLSLRSSFTWNHHC